MRKYRSHQGAKLPSSNINTPWIINNNDDDNNNMMKKNNDDNNNNNNNDNNNNNNHYHHHHHHHHQHHHHHHLYHHKYKYIAHYHNECLGLCALGVGRHTTLHYSLGLIIVNII